MNSHKIVVSTKRNFHQRRSLQLCLLAIFWLVGEVIVQTLKLPVPGGVVGMFIVLALLGCHGLKISSLRLGANWLLAEMLLFFIPAVPSIMDHNELISVLGLKLLAVIVCGSAVVMGVTALTTEFAYRWYVSKGVKTHAA